MVPIVQVKLLWAEAAKVIFGLAPLHIVTVFVVVTTGIGLTVTVMVSGVPTHDPPVEVAVTTYATVAAALLVLVRTWSMAGPKSLPLPEIEPVTAPIVQAKLLVTLASSEIAGLVPLHIVAVMAFVTEGFGLTVTTIEYGTPGQDAVVAVGVIIYSTVPCKAFPGLINV